MFDVGVMPSDGTEELNLSLLPEISDNLHKIFAGKPLSFIPWLTIKALALLVFSSMAVFEVSVGSGVSR